MKKILVLLVISLLGAGAFAQTDQKMNKMKSEKMMQGKDCVMMKDGKMMVMKNGATMAMDKDMTMSNGTTVMTDGTVKMKDGKTMMLKDGECVYMNGKMGSMNHMKMNKMEKDTM